MLHLERKHKKIKNKIKKIKNKKYKKQLKIFALIIIIWIMPV
jgi:hypothetical protein